MAGQLLKVQSKVLLPEMLVIQSEARDVQPPRAER